MGFKNLQSIRDEPMAGFTNTPLQTIMGRVTFICEFFRAQVDRASIVNLPKGIRKKKTERPIVERQIQEKPEVVKKVKVKGVVNKDDTGNIIYPVILSSSLRLLNSGVIKPGPNFHSEHNLFPVGYVCVRWYASTLRKGQKTEYTCEILDGGDRPLFRITPADDPQNPVERVTTS